MGESDRSVKKEGGKGEEETPYTASVAAAESAFFLSMACGAGGGAKPGRPGVANCPAGEGKEVDAKVSPAPRRRCPIHITRYKTDGGVTSFAGDKSVIKSRRRPDSPGWRPSRCPRRHKLRRRRKKKCFLRLKTHK